MKKILVFIVFVISVKVFSQEIKSSEQQNVVFEKDIEIKGGKTAQYPGGIDAYRRNFSQLFDGSKVNAKGIIKSEAQFVVNEEGKVTEIRIIGDNQSMNKEMERVIKAMAKTSWKPAEINGLPVKYRFRLPITMNFE